MSTDDDYNVCDKCKTAVPDDNNAVTLEAIRSGDLMYLLAYPRHLLPVVVDGVTVCTGSPSRAQYLEGQPRDTRGYGYYPELEASTREAYRQLVEESTAPA